MHKKIHCTFVIWQNLKRWTWSNSPNYLPMEPVWCAKVDSISGLANRQWATPNASPQKIQCNRAPWNQLKCSHLEVWCSPLLTDWKWAKSTMTDVVGLSQNCKMIKQQVYVHTFNQTQNIDTKNMGKTEWIQRLNLRIKSVIEQRT